MKMAPRYLVAVMASFCVGTFASQVLAQPNRGREAAIHKCEIQAVNQYHRKGGDDTSDRARVSVYKDCMVNAGFAP
jgi:hypothetical protein